MSSTTSPTPSCACFQKESTPSCLTTVKEVCLAAGHCSLGRVCVCVCVGVCMCVCSITSVTSASLRPYGLWPTRLLCPWNLSSNHRAAHVYPEQITLYVNFSNREMEMILLISWLAMRV